MFAQIRLELKSCPWPDLLLKESGTKSLGSTSTQVPPAYCFLIFSIVAPKEPCFSGSFSIDFFLFMPHPEIFENTLMRESAGEIPDTEVEVSASSSAKANDLIAWILER